jgi:hypothetical protein
MDLKLVAVNVNRNAHPNAVFAVLQNDKGESASVQIHLAASQNVDHLTLEEIERLAREEARRLFI